MEVLYERCCGIDVHKRVLVCCLKCGNKQEIRTFDSNNDEIRELTKWLQQRKCQIIAMESTGSYWKPLYNIFELSGLDAIVANARDIKNVPGRKTDIGDAEWIADLLRHGLIKASYIPNREQRELRELSRYRISLVRERARELNRLQKMLEGGNVKLSNVVSNINGRSARKLLQSMLESDEPLTRECVEGMIHGKLVRKVDAILKAMNGFLTPLQKELIRRVVDHIDDMSQRIGEMDDMLSRYLQPYQEAIEKLDELPGIGKRSAETIIIETGLDMSRFATDKHFSSWAGLAPGNNESAQKRRRCRVVKGNQTLRTTLVQCAKAASRCKSYFRAQYQRLVVRRGANRATVAVAHSMLIAIYHILKSGKTFIDLGEDFYTQFNRDKKITHHLKQLTKLGWLPHAAEDVAIA
ncbi:IS110 family RNA-guided transposase [Selenomonas massiliensis]|uniref:IS110 family transposase n=2 Tax=Selenomonas massiliensis TaxID=2058293 RepID=UPI000D0F8EB6|nr:IS110 family transposase [Selenomonas massiliensis]